MSLIDQTDPRFEEFAHQRLGARRFTLAHSAAQAWAMIIVGAICVLVVGIVFILPVGDGVKLLVTLPAGVVGVISAVAGPVQLVRSRKRIDIYDGGIIEKEGRHVLEMPFQRIMEATIDLTEQRGTLVMKVRLISGVHVLAFVDAASFVEVQSQQRIRALSQHIADRIPRHIELTGLHNLTRA